MFVRRAYIPEESRPGRAERGQWPFTVPAVAQLAEQGLEFRRPVTFLVGDNGSGKSSLVEAIAEGFRLDFYGGRPAPALAGLTPSRRRWVRCCGWRPLQPEPR